MRIAKTIYFGLFKMLPERKLFYRPPKIAYMLASMDKGKGKIPPRSVLLTESVTRSGDQILHALATAPLNFIRSQLHTLYPLCGSALTDTTDTLSETTLPIRLTFTLYI